MKSANTIILATLIVLGGGCAKSTPQPTVLPAPPEHVSENTPGEIVIDSKQLKQTVVLNEFGSCSIDLSYPSFPNGDLDPVQQLQLEHEIANFIAESLNSSAEVDSPADLQPLVDTYLATCKNEIADEYQYLSDAGEELFMNLKRNVEIDFNVTLNANQLLSIELNNYAYTGGAHGNQSSIYLNADRANNKLLTLGDLIDQAHLKAFMQLEKTQLLKDNRDSLYPESATAFDTLVADQNWLATDDEKAKYGALTNFSLTPTSIITHYNAYDIAPYAAGPIDVEIPYANIQAMLNPTGPLVNL